MSTTARPSQSTPSVARPRRITAANMATVLLGAILFFAPIVAGKVMTPPHADRPTSLVDEPAS